MLSKLEKIKQQVSKGESSDLGTSIYYLIKELKCLPEIIGREFEVEYDDKGRIKKIKQLPISITALIMLLDEMEADYKRQEKENRKKGRR